MELRLNQTIPDLVVETDQGRFGLHHWIGAATPAKWNLGDDMIIPAAMSDADAAGKFGRYTLVLPYLRTTRVMD